MTKRVCYSTAVSIVRILDTHCVALESHAGALSN